jgi:hypothetical protein
MYMRAAVANVQEKFGSIQYGVVNKIQYFVECNSVRVIAQRKSISFEFCLADSMIGDNMTKPTP